MPLNMMETILDSYQRGVQEDRRRRLCVRWFTDFGRRIDRADLEMMISLLMWEQNLGSFPEELYASETVEPL